MNMIIMLILLLLLSAIIIPIIYAIYFSAKTKTGASKIEEILEENNFNTSNKVNYGNKFQVCVDVENKKVAIGITYPDVNVTFLKFSQIIDCRITENSNLISGGGVGRAIVGGALAGGVGAIVGANTKKSSTMLNNFCIDIITNDINNSVVRLKMVDSPIDITTYGNIYKDIIRFSNDVYALIQSVISNKKSTIVKQETESKTNDNNINQLDKLAELKEKGIITEEEFEESKKKILSKL